MSQEKISTDVRQEQIAEAALAIVNEEGQEALSVAKVAERVGIVPSAIYRHFDGKDQIILAVLQLIRLRMKTNLENVCAQTPDPLQRLHLLLQRHIEMISQNSGIPRLIFSHEVVGGTSGKKAALFEVIKEHLERLAAIFADGQAIAKIRQDVAPATLAVMFLGLIQPAAIIFHISQGRFDLHNHADNAWRLFSECVQLPKLGATFEI